MNKSLAGRWIRWLLFSEGLILLLALAGPGRRTGARRRDNLDLLARLFLEDPSYLEAVVVNFIAINIFVVLVFLVAWLVTRIRN